VRHQLLSTAPALPPPQGAKVVQYWRCQHEVFAQFGECARWDGLSEKLMRYEDDGCTVVEEVVEAFQRRHDKLRERRSLPPVSPRPGLAWRGVLVGSDLAVLGARRVVPGLPSLL
jgi:hypothetical protein